MLECAKESELHRVWRNADSRRARVKTTDGREYKLVYSGMPGGSRGPDFRDAVLEAADGAEILGDVEIHRLPESWYAHGHHLDPSYNHVAFHAVGDPGEREVVTVDSLGMLVPQIDIRCLRDRDLTLGVGGIGSGGQLERTIETGASWLDRAGDERFAAKVRSRRVDVETFGVDLALQVAVFECLGYPNNRAGFIQLARRSPWAYLCRFAGSSDPVTCAETLLQWAAGLGERPDWAGVPRLFGDAPAWVAAAGRPSNRTEARIAAGAHLVARWWENGGPLRHALATLEEANKVSDLRDAFRVAGGVLGSGRAGEIIVNAVLPTLAAWAESGRDRVLFCKLLDFYAEHPKLPSNSVLREAESALGRRGIGFARVRGARQQQGLMHLYRSILIRPRQARQLPLGERVVSL